MIARPSFNMPITRAHRRSRNLAVILPTNTPGAISINHLDKSPLTPGGQAVKTITVIAAPHHWNHHTIFLLELLLNAHPITRHGHR